MQLDIGFGDVITPGPTEIEYPALLNFPAPVLQASPKETVIAEKLEALTALGILNGRLKDYYDLALLSRTYPFEGDRLSEAIVATFRHRGTAIEPEPIGLTRAYSDDPARGFHSQGPPGFQRDPNASAERRRFDPGLRSNVFTRLPCGFLI